MAYQFLHIDTVSRETPKKAKAKRWPLRDIIAEASRAPQASTHIALTRTPTLLDGIALSDLEPLVNARAEDARDGVGRKLRKDAPILIAGVASYPVALDDMTENDHQRYGRWEKDTVRWLKERHRHRLVSVVRHDDERFPHIHFFVLPDLGNDGRLDIRAVHPGIEARERCREGGGDRSAQSRAYCEAMREVQDDYQREVGFRHGLLRTGPKRRRLTRSAYQELKRQTKERTNMIDRVENDILESENRRLSSVEATALRASIEVLQERNNRLVVELTEAKRAISQMEQEVGRLLKKVRSSGPRLRHCAKALTGLIRLVATGDDECRRWLGKADRPAVVEESDWTLMRSLLRRSGSSLRQRKIDVFQR